MSVAGIWETWHSGMPDERWSFSILTTAANEFMREIHDRMPVILGRADEDAWLDPEVEPETVKKLLKPCPSSWLHAVEVSTLVNSAKNNSPEVLEAVTETAGLGDPVPRLFEMSWVIDPSGQESDRYDNYNGHCFVAMRRTRLSESGLPCRALRSISASLKRVAAVTVLLVLGGCGSQSDCVSLQQAALYGHTAEVEVFLNSGSFVNERSPGGSTALMGAAVEGHVDTAELLLSRGALIDAVDNKGNTPLLNAAYYARDDMVRFLLSRGAQIEARNQDGGTALMATAVEGHISTAGILLERGADVNGRDRRANTALIWAASRGHEKLVRLLLDHGADLGLTTVSGITAASAAQEKGFQDLAVTRRDLLT